MEKAPRGALHTLRDIGCTEVGGNALPSPADAGRNGGLGAALTAWRP